MQILGFYICIALSLLAGIQCDCSFTAKPSRCIVQYRCSDEEAPVWTTNDGRLCQVFRNECLMLSTNCDLLNENKPEYKEITQTQCQELCREMVCLAVFQPVCGSYNGKFRTFGNYCEMKRHICTTGETFSLYKEEACPE